MVPSIAQLRQHRAYLLTGQSTLAPDQARFFRQFLDDIRPDLTLPFPAATPADHSLADSLVAAYGRHRHNDWSSAFTRRHFLNNSTLPGGYSFVDDLVPLCESHHWSIDKVRNASTLDPRRIGSPAQPVDLRYLACLLRIANILENDPERTPPLLYIHRDVVPSSRLYWERLCNDNYN